MPSPIFQSGLKLIVGSSIIVSQGELFHPFTLLGSLYVWPHVFILVDKREIAFIHFSLSLLSENVGETEIKKERSWRSAAQDTTFKWSWQAVYRNLLLRELCNLLKCCQKQDHMSFVLRFSLLPFILVCIF